MESVDAGPGAKMNFFDGILYVATLVECMQSIKHIVFGV